MVVELTDLAEASLREIYCRFPKESAQKVVEGILDKTATLCSFPNRGRIVEELRELNQGHRFIVTSHYKIIYLPGKGIVWVTDIFDMSQDPLKIKERYLS